MTDTSPAPEAETDKPKRIPTEVKVQFVDDIPERTAGSQPNRKSKYDAVYAMLSENPGRWAYIGEGKNLHGSLIAYKKRRGLEDMTIAWRNQAVYAGVSVDAPDTAKSAPAAETEAVSTPVGGMDKAESSPAPESPVFPVSTGAGGEAGGTDSW